MALNCSSHTPHYEQVPFEVPDGWVWTTLEEICLFLSRGKSPKYSDTDKTYPVFAQKCNLKEGGISLEQARFLDPSTICKWSEEYRLKTGDVLVNSTGTGTVGRTRLFHEGYLKNYPFVVPDSHVSVIRTTNEVKSEFVFAYISSQLIQQYLEDNLAGSTNQKELYIGVLSDLSFPLPPRAEQHRIVAEIERLFSLIDIIETGKDGLRTAIKQTKSKILDLAIHGKLIPQDPNDEPAIELLKRINPNFTPCDNAHYTQLPSGWAYSRLGDICKLKNGYAFKSGLYSTQGVRIIRIANVQDGYIEDDAPQYYDFDKMKGLDSFLLSDGDLLMSLTGNVGRVCFITKKFLPAALNQRVACVRNNEVPINKEYLYHLFQSEKFVKDCKNSGKGVAQQNISTEWLKEYIVPLPPLLEQDRIVTLIKGIYSYLDTIMESL